MPGPCSSPNKFAPSKEPAPNSPPKKVQARLAARQADWFSRSQAVTEIHKPGSQNRKK